MIQLQNCQEYILKNTTMIYQLQKKKTMDHKYKPKKVKHIIKNCGLKMKNSEKRMN